MKATELMIGDWVVHIPTKKNVRIIGINPDGTIGITAPLDDGSKFWWVFTDSLEHILLTPEILEKNGFKFHSFSGGKYYKWERPEFVINDSMVDSVGQNNFHYEYVHQLQHALRSCDLDELADNFKI